MSPIRVSLAILATALAAGACGGDPPERGTLTGVVVAGPTCPDEPAPGAGDCRDRPVRQAAIRIVKGGDLVRAVRTDARGRFTVTLLEGHYRIEPQRVPGLLGTAAARQLSVTAGRTTCFELRYDTGVRGDSSAAAHRCWARSPTCQIESSPAYETPPGRPSAFNDGEPAQPVRQAAHRRPPAPAVAGRGLPGIPEQVAARDAEHLQRPVHVPV